MRFFNSIRKKVWLCVYLVFAGFIAATLFTLASNARLKDHLSEIRDLDFKMAMQSAELATLFERQRELYEESFLFGMEDSARQANELTPRVIQLMDTVEGLIGQEHHLHQYPLITIDSLRENFGGYAARAAQLYPVLAQGEDPGNYVEEIKDLGRKQSELRAEFERFSGFYNRSFQRDVTTLIQKTDSDNVLMVVLFLGLLGVMSILVNLIANRMLIHPLGLVKDAVHRFGLGERHFPQLEAMDEKDDIGELGLTFQKMMEDLQVTTVSKAYVDSILRNLTDSLVVVSPEFRIESVNQATLNLLGYREVELAGAPISMILENFTEPDLQKKDYFPFEQLCRNIEKYFLTKSGHRIPVLLSTSFLTENNHQHVRGLVYVAKDITDIRRVQDELRKNHQFLENVFESISHPFYVINVADYTVSLFNTAAGVTPAEEGTTCYQLSHHSEVPCSGKDHLCPLLEAVKTRKPVQTEHRHGERIFEVHGYPVFDDDGNVTQIIEYSLDITERKMVEQKLEHMAQFDFLTGLPNRLVFHEQLGQTLVRARRENAVAGVMFLDLDRFKIINDSLGHSYGDELLKTIADRLSHCARESDVIARLGGDEFAVILYPITRAQDMARMAIRILNDISEPIHYQGYEFFTSGSIGIALYPHDGKNAEDLLKNADMAMYRAKQEGGNTYRFFSNEMNERSKSRHELENKLRNALGRSEFLLHYQPQFNLSSGNLVGIEALLRWAPNKGDFIMPADFVPVLEETGMIHEVGEWVLRDACNQSMLWQKAGLLPLRVAVNVSARQLQQGDLIAQVQSVLAETGLPPQYLELELTESIFLQNMESNVQILRQLKQLGISLAIDDFGTGYSSLSYLQHFPIDRLKIDRLFIRDIGKSSESGAIAKAIIAMSKSLDLQVIAEGVESAPQLEFLRRHRCQEGQGYFFGHPIGADDLIDTIIAQKFPLPSLAIN